MTNIFAEGGIVTALGLLVVFSCLILIILLITVLSAIMKERKKPETRTEQRIEHAVHEPLPPEPVVEVQQDELIAVLTAAVAAYLEEEETEAAPSGFVVRSYRRAAGDSQWARAGRNAQIYNNPF